MRQAGWRRALTVATVVPVMAVTGCVGEDPVDEPTATAVVSASTTPTPSPSPTVDLTKLPEKPAAMAEPTTDGAIAAASYVLDLYVYTINSGDDRPWRAIGLASCVFCAEVADDVADMRSRGETYRGGAVEVRRSDVREITQGQWYGVTVDASQEASQRLDSGGNVLVEDPAAQYTVVFALSWSEGWGVDSMGVSDDSSGDGGSE